MKKILMTGGTGFVGYNVLLYLQKKGYIVDCPKRSDVDLKNEKEVCDFLNTGNYDVILHFASPTPAKNSNDKQENLLEDGLRMFMNFYKYCNLYGKMIYTGSGAEYDKSMNCDCILEDDCFRSTPSDTYGFMKYIMNELSKNSKNIYNFRIFGCYGPGDLESKFITHCIRSVKLDKPITIRKDCFFDYLHVYDFARFIEWGITHEMKYHNYNVATGKPILLSDIAKKVIKKMKSNLDIVLLSNELNNNYTANNTRIIEESGLEIIYPIDKGLELQIDWENKNWNECTKFDGK